MKELLNQYASYDVWANKRIIECVLDLSETQQKQHVASSFSNLFETFYHLWKAQHIWWFRLQQNTAVTGLGEITSYSMKEIADGLLQHSVQWEQWVHGASTMEVEKTLHYYNSNKGHFAEPVWQILMQLFNHNTYHRGQIVTMLHQLEVTSIPGTDFILFVRGVNK